MPKTEDYYKGKTIVITGAGSGIGRATAKVFGREGANVVSTDIDVEAAERTANEVIQIGAEATFARCDVTIRAEVDAAVKQAVGDFGQLHFGLNSAGAAMGRRPKARNPLLRCPRSRLLRHLLSPKMSALHLTDYPLTELVFLRRCVLGRGLQVRLDQAE